FGVQTTYIDGRRIENWQEATLPNTAFFYLESPNSWEFALQPLEEVAQFARSRQIITMIDNSYATPIYQPVISLGIDLAMQTATKYIGGHSDTLGGVLSGSKAMMKRIFDSEYLNIGSGMQPFNAWLLIRGLRTLPARLDRISHSTQKVYDYLRQHPAIERVIFPFDESFPQYALAKKQIDRHPPPKLLIGFRQVNLHDSRKGGVQVIGLGLSAVHDLDRVCPTWDRQNGALEEVGTELLGIEGCRCDDDFQVRAFLESLLQETEEHICGDSALVGFVKHDDAIPSELRIQKNLSLHDTIGHVLDSSAAACLVFKTDSVADFFADSASYFVGHTCSHTHGGNTTWLCTADDAVVGKSILRKILCELCSLATASVSDHNHQLVLAYCFQELFAHLESRQRLALLFHGHHRSLAELALSSSNLLPLR
ncbi:MAG: PLP-dependent transferase, partial [Cytophagaceae bacterium]